MHRAQRVRLAGDIEMARIDMESTAERVEPLFIHNPSRLEKHEPTYGLCERERSIPAGHSKADS